MINSGILSKLGLVDVVNDYFSKEGKRQRIRKKKIEKQKALVRKRNKNKVFVIGFNKSGTTSVEHALMELGFILFDQGEGTKVFNKLIKEDYSDLFELITTAEAFQDIPFSFPLVYEVLDEKFPGSKFILTVRDSPEQWFNSLTKFHSKIWGEGELPTPAKLEETDFSDSTNPREILEHIFGTAEYKASQYQEVYKKHIIDVQEYFKNRPGQLIIINVSNEKDYSRMCGFLEVEELRSSFSWENRT
jgi:hypothetical protein